MMNEAIPADVLMYQGRPMYSFLYHGQKPHILFQHHASAFLSFFIFWEIIVFDNGVECTNSLQKYEFCSLLVVCLYIIYDFFNVVRTEPLYLFVAFEPRELFATVFACVALYACDGLVERHVAVEVGK